MEHIRLNPVDDLVETLAINTAFLAGHAGFFFFFCKFKLKHNKNAHTENTFHT